MQMLENRLRKSQRTEESQVECGRTSEAGVVGSSYRNENDSATTENQITDDASLLH